MERVASKRRRLEYMGRARGDTGCGVEVRIVQKGYLKVRRSNVATI